jgi:hypothetical protein
MKGETLSLDINEKTVSIRNLHEVCETNIESTMPVLESLVSGARTVGLAHTRLHMYECIDSRRLKASRDSR